MKKRIYFEDLTKQAQQKIYEQFAKEGRTDVEEVDDLINRCFWGEIRIEE